MPKILYVSDYDHVALLTKRHFFRALGSLVNSKNCFWLQAFWNF